MLPERARVSGMRLGGEPVGRWGLSLMVVTAVTGALLAWHGWTSGRPAIAGSFAGARPRAATATSAPRSARSPGAAVSSPAAAASPSAATSSSPAPSPSRGAATGGAGPLLSSEPFANVAYQVWPGPVSTTARLALTGLSVSVHKSGSGLSVTAGVKGQAPGAPHLYVGGVRVYVVEAAFGDDSGGADYSLGDDGLVVTDAQGRIIR